MPKHWWLDKGDEPAGDAEDDSVSPKPPRKPLHIKRWQIMLSGSLGVALALFGWLWIAISHGMPTLDELENLHPELATQLISADGERLDQYYIKNRRTARLKGGPPDVVAA